ncbi:MAG: N-acetylmuramoyl-L-alanine amidase [Sphingobacteriaceae bacterium]|nr:N-acetylmuramoyl-L-alanine amidase [Sphingobacteriaceae bacterium]
MVKKLQYLSLIAGLFVLSISFIPPRGKGSGIKIIVIDPGHGGKDPGCNGVSHKEKDVSLAVALKLGKLIEDNLKDVKVIYTRTTDVFVELEERAQIANRNKADLFISIHCNAAGKVVYIKDKKTGKKRVKTYKNKKGKYVPVEKPNPVPFGTETYVMGLKNEEGKMKVATRENSAIFLEDNYETKYGGFDPESEESYIIMSNYTSAYVLQSASLAVKLQEEYTKKAGRYDRGVHRQSIWVLWRTSMPSILTEIGYLTNPLEEKFLASEQGQDYLAKAIFRGLRRYKDEQDGNKKEYNDDIEKQEPLENENIKAGNIPGQKHHDEDEEDEEDEKPKEEKKLVNKDSLIVNEKNKADTIQIAEQNQDSLDAKAIAEKFKEQQKSEEKKPEEEKKVVDEQKIRFKVQFASSDAELNLNEKKFSDIKDGAFYKQKNVLKYTSGNFKTMKEAAAHQHVLREKGFKDCFVIAMKGEERMDLMEAKKETGQ